MTRPGDRASEPSGVAYYQAAADALADSAAAVERGRPAGVALGEDPMLALGALVARFPRGSGWRAVDAATPPE